MSCERVWWDDDGIMQVSRIKEREAQFTDENPNYGYMKYHFSNPTKVYDELEEIEIDGVLYEVETTHYKDEVWYEIMDDNHIAIGHYVPEDNTIQWTTTEEMMKHGERVDEMKK